MEEFIAEKGEFLLLLPFSSFPTKFKNVSSQVSKSRNRAIKG